MAINRFTQAAPFEAINTYVPLPFEELAMAGAAKQQQYDIAGGIEDQLLADAGQQYGLSQIRDLQTGEGLPWEDAAKVQEMNNYFNQEVTKLSESIPDKGDPMFMRGLQKLRREYQQQMSPQGVYGTAKHNIAARDEINKMIQENEQVADQPWLLNELARQYRNISSSGTMGSIQTGFAIGDKVNRAEEADKIISGINSELVSLYGGRYGDLIKSGKKEEISEDKIRMAARNLLPSTSVIASLQEEMEMRNDILKRQGYSTEEANKLSTDKFNEEYNRIEDGLVAKYRGSSGSMTAKESQMAINAHKKTLEAQGGASTSTMTINTTKIEDAVKKAKRYISKNKFWNEDGSFKKEFAKGDVIDLGGFEGMKVSSTFTVPTGQEEASSVRYGEFIDAIRISYPETSDLSDKETFEKWVNHVDKNIVKQTIRYNITNKDENAYIKDLFTSNLKSSNVEIVGGETTGDPDGKKNYIKELGYKDDAEFKKVILNKNIILGYDIQNGKITMEVPTGNNKGTKTIRFDGDNETKVTLDLLKTIDDTFNNSRKQDEFFLPLEDGRVIHVDISGIRNIVDEKSDRKTKIRYLNEKGEPINDWQPMVDEDIGYGTMNPLYDAITRSLQGNE